VTVRSGIFLLALIACLPISAGANPVIDPDERGCQELVSRLISDRDTTLENRFVRCLGLYGFASLDSTAHALMSAHLARFEPLIARTQGPPYTPDRDLLDWYLPLASAGGRDAIRASLHAWFEGDGVPASARRDPGWSRCLAADALTDEDDSSAIPLLRSVLEPARVAVWTRSAAGTGDFYRVQIEHALGRLEKRDLPGGISLRNGRVAWGERAEDLEKVTITFFENHQWTDFVSPREEGTEFWKLLDNTPGSTLYSSRIADKEFRLHFVDGVAVRVSLLGADSIAIIDNAVPLPFDGYEPLPAPMILVRDAAIHDAAATLAASGSRTEEPRWPFSPTRAERDLLDRVALGHADADERLLITILDAQSFAFLDSSALDLMAQHLEVFRPLLVRAQRFPLTPDQRLLQWMRVRGTPADRRALTESMLDFLRPSKLEIPRFVALGDQLPLRKVLAAEALADWGESRALPEIDRLLATPEIKDRGGVLLRFWLQQSELRLRDPLHAGLLAPSKAGGVALHRSFADVDTIYRSLGFSFNRERAVPLSQQESQQVWSLLAQARDPTPTDASQGKWMAIVIRLRDGLEATLSLSSKGEVLYEDNSRVDPAALTHSGLPRWKILYGSTTRIEQPELAAYLERLQSLSATATQ
jgi:hypothetical protein